MYVCRYFHKSFYIKDLTDNIYGASLKQSVSYHRQTKIRLKILTTFHVFRTQVVQAPLCFEFMNNLHFVDFKRLLKHFNISTGIPQLVRFQLVRSPV